ncbi:MAG: aquaporin, partial [Candidatus Micrarchaeota archaeon]|nr:aquaporin [Candidatus Micrarchaeota archaeon]
QAVMLSGFGAPSLSSNISIWQGIIIEAAITFVLASAVFGTVVDKRAPKIAGFGVGLALFIGILVAGPFTGAAANPARALGPEIVSLNFTNWYVYWIGPILGALIAALLYQYFLLDTKSKTRSS